MSRRLELVILIAGYGYDYACSADIFLQAVNFCDDFASLASKPFQAIRLGSEFQGESLIAMNS